MALTAKDVKDVSDLVTKKLELYVNHEKRENGFNPSGAVRTTHKMYKYDLMYRVLNYDVWDRDSPRYPKKEKKRESAFGETESKEKDRNVQNDSKSTCIDPKVVNTSRRMCLYKEVDRLASNASKLFEACPIDKLQVIHRYRPSYHGKIEDTTKTGKVQNYTRHVGAVLKSQDYVNYYIKEGLQTGDAAKSKRLQEFPEAKNTKEEENQDKKDKNLSGADRNKEENKKKQEGSRKTMEPTIRVTIKQK